jgi:uncharacterized protein YjdB
MVLAPNRGQQSSPFPARPAALRPYSVRWTSSDPLTATVDANGKVTGLRAGIATITATLKWQNTGPALIRRSRISVGTPVAAVQVARSLSIPHYCTKEITAQPFDSQGRPLDDRPVRWVSNAPQVVAVRQSSGTNAISLSAANDIYYRRTALLLGGQVGQAVITVTSESVTRTVTVVVGPSDPTSLELLPDQLELDVQETAYAMGVIHNQEGCIDPGASLVWKTDDPTVATVTTLSQPQRVAVQGLKVGTTKLTAMTQNGLTAGIDVSIPPVNVVVVNPRDNLELDLGAQRTVTATTLSSSGKILRNRVVTWGVSSSAITAQPSSGNVTTVTGKAVGSAVLMASSEGISTSLSVTVPTVASVTISPSSATLSVGSSKDFTATLRSSSGTPLNNRALTWSASNNRVTLQSSTGYTVRVTGSSSGDASLIASSEEKSGSASIHVRTYCEEHVCASSWRVENYSSNRYDLYQVECSSAGCSAWIFQETVPPDSYYQSQSLVENNVYIVRAVTVGCDPDIANCFKMESYPPFVGGPGPVAIFPIF